MTSAPQDDSTKSRTPVVTANDLLATSSGLAAGTVVGSVVGALIAAGPAFPVVLGIAGMAATGIGYRLLRGDARRETDA